MSTHLITIELSATEARTIAHAVRASAVEAYCDGRLLAASDQYRLAARCYLRTTLGSEHAQACLAIAQAIRNEAIAREAGDEDEADYLEGQVLELQKGAA